MNSKTKIVVLHLKELIYTGIFAALGILFVILLIIMFLPKNKNDMPPSESMENSVPESSAEDFSLNENPDIVETSYIPGVYTSALPLSGYSVDMEVVVNESGISSVRLVNLDEAVTTMYPLMEPTLASVSTQLAGGQPLSSVTYQDENKYTTLILLETIQTCLDKAAVVSE